MGWVRILLFSLIPILLTACSSPAELDISNAAEIQGKKDELKRSLQAALRQCPATSTYHFPKPVLPPITRKDLADQEVPLVTSQDGSQYISVVVNDAVRQEFLVDTGSTLIVVPRQFVVALGCKGFLKNDDVVGAEWTRAVGANHLLPLIKIRKLYIEGYGGQQGLYRYYIFTNVLAMVGRDDNFLFSRNLIRSVDLVRDTLIPIGHQNCAWPRPFWDESRIACVSSNLGG